MIKHYIAVPNIKHANQAEFLRNQKKRTLRIIFARFIRFIHEFRRGNISKKRIYDFGEMAKQDKLAPIEPIEPASMIFERRSIARWSSQDNFLEIIFSFKLMVTEFPFYFILQTSVTKSGDIYFG